MIIGWIFLAAYLALMGFTILIAKYAVRQMDKKKKGW